MYTTGLCKIDRSSVSAPLPLTADQSFASSYLRRMMSALKGETRGWADWLWMDDDKGGGSRTGGGNTRKGPSVFRPVTTKVRNPTAPNDRPGGQPLEPSVHPTPHAAHTDARANNSSTELLTELPRAIARRKPPFFCFGFGFRLVLFGHHRETARPESAARASRRTSAIIFRLEAFGTPPPAHAST